MKSRPVTSPEETVPILGREIESSASARNMTQGNSPSFDPPATGTVGEPNADAPQRYLQREIDGYNISVGYGQSLMEGVEAWPALSKKGRYGNLMLGGSVRPQNLRKPNYIPLHAPALHPLQECVQTKEGELLSDAEVAALSAGNVARGETIFSGALNCMKRLQSDRTHSSQDSTRVYVAVNAAVGGKTIEALSPGSDPIFYRRYLQALKKVVAVGKAHDIQSAVTAIVWMQGEQNYIPKSSGTRDRLSYEHLLNNLHRSMIKDAMRLTGQASPPAFLMYQTAGVWVRDKANLSISMAQLDFAESTDGVYLVGPIYPYPNKGGHLDPNGTRWFGAQVGKVYDQVVALGKDWTPLAPIMISVSENNIRIDFSVPVPPLMWGDTFEMSQPKQYENRGFKVTDSGGEVAISSTEITGPTQVTIGLERPLGAEPHVWYGSQSTRGGGNLRDSDSRLADDVYEYREGTGQYPEANLEALVDHRYPLHNFSVIFRLPIPWRSS